MRSEAVDGMDMEIAWSVHRQSGDLGRIFFVLHESCGWLGGQLGAGEDFRFFPVELEQCDVSVVAADEFDGSCQAWQIPRFNFVNDEVGVFAGPFERAFRVVLRFEAMPIGAEELVFDDDFLQFFYVSELFLRLIVTVVIKAEFFRDDGLRVGDMLTCHHVAALVDAGAAADAAELEMFPLIFVARLFDEFTFETDADNDEVCRVVVDCGGGLGAGCGSQQEGHYDRGRQ